MFDAFYLSYDEIEAEENLAKIRELWPHVRWVHGVKGLYNAHKECARRSRTDNFYVIDADSELLPSVDLKYMPKDRGPVHIWRARNPINNLIYGYGGLKLFPVQAFEYDGDVIDMTTTINKQGVKIVHEIATITRFNTSPWRTWRGAFRECVKLSSKTISRQKDFETEERLDVWCTVGEEANFGLFALSGAQAGRRFGEQNKENPKELGNINDYDWLRQKFLEEFPNEQ